MKRVFVILLMFIAARASAHDLPAQLPEPLSVGEAWNVALESSANVDELIAGKLLQDAVFQLANIATSLEYFAAHSDEAKVKALAGELLSGTVDLVKVIQSRGKSYDATKAQWLSWRKSLAELETKYPADEVHAAVYICSMHPLDRHTAANEKCSKCGMSLSRRHLPASSVYQKPGEPTISAMIVAEPLVVGKAADVRIRLSKRDGSPVLLGDLNEVHTQKIHLLINDRSLGDYHHEHPNATNVPGEYAFRFTPAKPGPYRVFADIVPAVSGVQEYVATEIPATSAPEAVTNKQPTFESTLNGRVYKLTLNAKDIHAGQTVLGAVEIATTDGKPVTNLEPVMGAFAHLVAFNEDLKTVLHIHPADRSPTGDSDRGGPAFAFKLYSPTPGFFRLYVQVQIDGKQQFAPLNLKVLPTE